MNDSPFDWAPMLERARAAAGVAYAPYSRFHVGACAMDADGRFFNGCNVESASYSLTICAERVAIFAARAAGSTKLARLAVTCPDAPGSIERRTPCGACRQVMCEHLAPDAEIMIDGVGVRTIRELLPEAFQLRS